MSKQVLVRLGPTLHRQLAIAAQREGISMNALMNQAIAAKLAREDVADSMSEKLLELITDASTATDARKPWLTFTDAEPAVTLT